MKKNLTLIFLFFICYSCFCNENLKELASKCAADFNEIETNNKQKYKLVENSIDSLNMQQPYLLSENLKNYINSGYKINKKQILKSYEENKKFVLIKFDGMSTESSSYSYVYNNGQIIGECCFSSGSDGSLVAGSFVYSLCFLDDNNYKDFWINFSLSKEEMEILKDLPEIFFKKNGFWYWKNKDARTKLYNLMCNNDKSLPKYFIDLQCSWNYILENLEINGNKIKIKNCSGL